MSVCDTSHHIVSMSSACLDQHVHNESSNELTAHHGTGNDMFLFQIALWQQKKYLHYPPANTSIFIHLQKDPKKKKDLPYACTKAQSIYGNLSGRQAHTDSRGLCADHHLLPKNRSLHLAFRWSLYLSCCHLNTLPLRCKSSQKTVEESEEPKEGSDLEMSSQPKFSGYMDGWISLNYILEWTCPDMKINKKKNHVWIPDSCMDSWFDYFSVCLSIRCEQWTCLTLAQMGPQLQLRNDKSQDKYHHNKNWMIKWMTSPSLDKLSSVSDYRLFYSIVQYR